jgi:hypothetical protein
MPISKHVWLGMLPTPLKVVDPCNGQHPLAPKNKAPSFYELQKKFGATFSFILMRNQTKLAPIYSSNIKESPCQVEVQSANMMWPQGCFSL